MFGGQSNFTVNCSGFDYCFPVTNHTWSFTETSSSGDHDDGNDKDYSTAVAFVIAVAVLVGFGIAFGGRAYIKSEEGGQCAGVHGVLG